MNNQNNDQIITNSTIPTRTTWTRMDCLLSQANITMPTMNTTMHTTPSNEFSETMEPFSNSFDHQISMIGIQFDADQIISDFSECYSPESVNSNYSNENDADSVALFNDTSLFHEMTKTTNNYTDNLAPMPNSQDFLSENLAEETENICATQFMSGIDIDKNQAFSEDEYIKIVPPIMENRGPIVFKDFLVNGNSLEINLTERMLLKNGNQRSTDVDDDTGANIIMAQTNDIHENPIIIMNANPVQSIPNSNSIQVAGVTDQMMAARKALPPLLMVPPTQLFNDTLSTPQIVNDVFEMVKDLDQKDNFDLITYIDQNENKFEKMYDSKPTQPIVSYEDIQKAYPTPSASPANKRSRQNSHDSMESTSTANNDVKPIVCDVFGDLIESRTPRTIRQMRTTRKRSASPAESIEAKRQRGRPRRTEPVPIPKNLSPDARKTAEARIKNNEASRRSRFTRREKELEMEQELERLEQKNVELHRMDALLDKEIAVWRQRNLKLGLLA